ncbi:hypothetical protein ACFW2X_06745 [Streptomyces antibioticus]|uniref:hypothetical protein n=1 Tax=Streptomyces antibioticus TaxID=1890 RepID=UPI003692593B
MTQISFDLHSYDGPALINGVGFARVRLAESAEQHGPGMVKYWEGTGEVARSAAPDVTPDWAFGPVEVRLPDGGTGTAFISGMTLSANRLGAETWALDLRGKGPSPMA